MADRYSIAGTTAEQVRGIGGTNVREARAVGLVFASLEQKQVVMLKDAGCKVTKISGVKAAVIAPPPPVAAVSVYTPRQLLEFAGLEKLRQLSVPPIYGENMTIAVIDTGIRETHTSIDGRVVYSKNFTSDPMRDGFNHGTAVASVVAAVAPLCNILNLKVLDNEGNGNEEDVVMAIDECLLLRDTRPDIAPSVINLSLGSDDIGDPDTPLRVACRAAIGWDILVVAAAGNTGPNPESVTSPACERYVGAVGSVSPDPFVISEWSSRGPTKEGLVKPDVVLFGENIIVASNEGDEATVAKSGTSFCSPFGAALMLLSQEGIIRGVMYPGGVPEGLEPGSRTVLTAVDLVDYWIPKLTVKPAGLPAGKDNSYGYGLPFGDLIANIIRPAAVDVSSLIGAVLAIGMLGAVMKSV